MDTSLLEGGLAYTAHLGGSLHVTLWDPDGTRHSSWLYPYRASGDVADAPIPLPMLALRSPPVGTYELRSRGRGGVGEHG